MNHFNYLRPLYINKINDFIKIHISHIVKMKFLTLFKFICEISVISWNVKSEFQKITQILLNSEIKFSK